MTYTIFNYFWRGITGLWWCRCEMFVCQRHLVKRTCYRTHCGRRWRSYTLTATNCLR